jgi:hypothetical protein
MLVDLSSLFGRSGRYSIKRDEYGRSARQRAFNAFDDGKWPAEVAKLVGISQRTARRYFADWKKIRQSLQEQRLEAALSIVQLLSVSKITPSQIIQTIKIMVKQENN